MKQAPGGRTVLQRLATLLGFLSRRPLKSVRISQARTEFDRTSMPELVETALLRYLDAGDVDSAMALFVLSMEQLSQLFQELRRLETKYFLTKGDERIFGRNSECHEHHMEAQDDLAFAARANRLGFSNENLLLALRELLGSYRAYHDCLEKSRSALSKKIDAAILSGASCLA